MQRHAIIFRPSKNAMQSGMGRSSQWVLSFVSDDRKQVDSIMGWISSADTTRQLNLFFPTQQAAEHYARENGVTYEVRQPHLSVPKPKSYAANFAHAKRQYSDITSAPKDATA